MNRMRVLIVGALAIVGAIVSAVSVPTALAAGGRPPSPTLTGKSGQIISGLTTKFHGKTASLCLTSTGAGAVSTQRCIGSRSQVWDLVRFPGQDDPTTLMNSATQQCLEGTHQIEMRTGGCSEADIAQAWDYVEAVTDNLGHPTPAGFGMLVNQYDSKVTSSSQLLTLYSNGAGQVSLRRGVQPRSPSDLWRGTGALKTIIDVGVN